MLCTVPLPPVLPSVIALFFCLSPLVPSLSVSASLCEGCGPSFDKARLLFAPYSSSSYDVADGQPCDGLGSPVFSLFP